MAKKPLEVGQRVWIETMSMFFIDKEREVYEYEVVKANKTSAYVVYIGYLEKYKNDNKKHKNLKRRVVQRTHEVIGNGFREQYGFWLTKEEFEENVKHENEFNTAKVEVMEIVDNLTLVELQEIQTKYG